MKKIILTTICLLSFKIQASNQHQPDDSTYHSVKKTVLKAVPNSERVYDSLFSSVSSTVVGSATGFAYDKGLDLIPRDQSIQPTFVDQLLPAFAISAAGIATQNFIAGNSQNGTNCALTSVAIFTAHALYNWYRQ